MSKENLQNRNKIKGNYLSEVYFPPTQEEMCPDVTFISMAVMFTAVKRGYSDILLLQQLAAQFHRWTLVNLCKTLLITFPLRSYTCSFTPNKVRLFSFCQLNSNEYLKWHWERWLWGMCLVQQHIIIIKFSRSEMDFYSTLDLEFAWWPVITFSPSEAWENVLLP